MKAKSQSLALVAHHPHTLKRGLNRLDVYSLLELFHRLPLPDLIRVGRVCRLWAKIRASACRARKEIFIQFGGSQKFGDSDCLCLEKVPANLGAILHSLLPNITSLNICFQVTQVEIDSIIDLIRQWAPQLIDLKLLDYDFADFDSPLKGVDGKLLRLLQSIDCDRFGELEELTFNCIANCIFPQNHDHTVSPFDLPIVSQLDLFTLHSMDNPLFLISSLEKYTGSVDRCIQLESRIDDRETVHKFLSISRNVAEEFVQISLRVWIDCALLKAFCLHFDSLVKLDIAPRFFTVSHLVHALQPLTELQELCILIDFEHLKLMRAEMIRQEVPAINEEEIKLEVYALASVEHLSLKIETMANHTDLNELQLDKWLPNLEQVQLRQACTVCGLHTYTYMEDDDDDKREQCLRSLLEQPFWSNFAELDPDEDVQLYDGFSVGTF